MIWLLQFWFSLLVVNNRKWCLYNVCEIGEADETKMRSSSGHLIRVSFYSYDLTTLSHLILSAFFLLVHGSFLQIE